MISRFFIDRPRFAVVIAILIVIAGAISIKNLPVKEYPTLTPPQITIHAIYPGADAQTVAKTVAAPLEEAINGVENVIYMTSTASSNGVLNISVYFKVGTNPDIAKIDVTNRVQTALSKLPEVVRRQGIDIRKRSPDILKIYAFVSKEKRRNISNLATYVKLNIADAIKRVKGVGDVVIFGSKQYSMRIWLIPDKLAEFNLTPLDVYNAIRRQNEEFSAGGIAQAPTNKTYTFSYSVKGASRFDTVKKFEDIIIRSNPDGSCLRLKDIARVCLGSENYYVNTYYNGSPAVFMGIYLSPGANALEVSKVVTKEMRQLSKNFPSDIRYYVPYNPTQFIRASIKEITDTLVIAIVLVICVVYLFLGDIRATLIPILAIPVSIIGTFAGLYIFGFSINLLTLFGLVLAIGLVVDDAIVVIENVERVIREEKLSVKDATTRAMKELTSPIVAIVLVLSAVFIPAAFIGGFSGKMFQQFAITITISMVISGIVALTLTPALCVVFLRDREITPVFFIRYFRSFFDKVVVRFSKTVRIMFKLLFLDILIYVGIVFFIFFLVHRLPTGLVPREDTGSLFIVTYTMPATSLKRTQQVVHKIERKILKNPLFNEIASVVGLDLSSFSYKTNAATSFVHLIDWSKRRGKNESSIQIARLLTMEFWKNKNAMIFAVNPPPIKGMSMTGGFEMYVQDRTGGSIARFNTLVHKIVYIANRSKELMGVRTSFDTNVAQYKIRVDREKAKALGVNINDIYRTLQMTFGKAYVNDFNIYGQIFHVDMESLSSFRSSIKDYRYVYVRSKSGALIPISDLVEVKRGVAPSVVERFNMFPAAKIVGSAKPGYSSGDAMKRIAEIARRVLPQGYTISWAGTSYQEKTVQRKGNFVYIFSLIFVFLILVALYESWTIPIAIMFTVPFAVLGALVGLFLMHLENDIYMQVGIITLIGLTVKNAILMVEFAEENRRHRLMELKDAALEAARVRFRPIMMTSIAFVAGSLPLVLSTGAGANSRHVIGNTVVWGMVVATFIGTLFIPIFYYLVIKSRTFLRKDQT